MYILLHKFRSIIKDSIEGSDRSITNVIILGNSTHYHIVCSLLNGTKSLIWFVPADVNSTGTHS